MGSRARIEIERVLGRRVFLGLYVKPREHWRDDPRILDELGITQG
jgi:GTP-binding protein Era